MNLDELAQKINKQNYQWWHDADGNSIERNRGELLMLAVSELSEALEGIRKNLTDDHLPPRKMEEVEMADAKIRLLDFAAGFGINDLSEYPIIKPFFTSRMNKGYCLLCIVKAISDTFLDNDFLIVAISFIENYCEVFNLDLEGALQEKLEYNLTRSDHSHEARAKAEGKKF